MQLPYFFISFYGEYDVILQNLYQYICIYIIYRFVCIYKNINLWIYVWIQFE